MMKPEPGDFEREHRDAMLRQQVAQLDDPYTLYRAVQKHDEFATERLFEELRRKWLRWIIGQLGDGNAEDVLADVFQALLEAIWSDRISEPAKLWFWVKSTVRFRTCEKIQQRSKGRELGDDVFAVVIDTVPDPEPSAEQRMINRERDLDRGRLLLDAFSELPALDREVVRRFYFLHQTRQQIEQEMSLTETQLRLRKSRAIAAMRLFVERRIDRRQVIEECRKRTAA